MTKQWFLGWFSGEEDGHCQNRLIKFANQNNLGPGEVVIMEYNANIKYLAFMYYAEKNLI
jgi:hypothetical protein